MTVEFYFSLSNILPSLFERRYYRPTKQAYQQAWASLGLCCTTCAEHCTDMPEGNSQGKAAFGSTAQQEPLLQAGV